MKKTLSFFAAGALVALLGVVAWLSVVYLWRMPSPSALAMHRPLQVTQVDPSWIRSGNPVFKFAEYFRSPDERTISGIWSCDGPTTFEWQFNADEAVHVLEGRVEIDYQGHHFVLETGDTAMFHEGTRAVWHVPEYIKKSYTLQSPNRVVRSWRQLSAWLGWN
jgi:uncharacterized cupin superfamily protein